MVYPNFTWPKFSKPTTRQWALIIRYVAYAVLIFAAYLLFNINSNTSRTVSRSNYISQQANNLAEDNKKLNNQNIKIASASQKHIDCIADLFARYTHDNKPITIQDLGTCQVYENDITKAIAESQASSQAPGTQTSNAASPTASTQGATNNGNAQGSNKAAAPVQKSENMVQKAAGSLVKFIEQL